MQENILSFNGSENFRKTLVSRNLKPYKIEGSFSSAESQQNYTADLTDSSPVDTPDISNDIYEEPKLNTIINIYGPAGNFIDGAELVNSLDIPQPPRPVSTGEEIGQNEYNPNFTKLDIINETFIDNVAVVNRYTPEGNYDDLFVVDEKILAKTSQQSGVYGDGVSSPINFVQGNYTVTEILNNDPELISDSYIQKIGAERLTYAFQQRIAREIERNTVGSINLGILTSPFEATLVATGQEPFIQRNYTITVPDGVIDYAAYFLQRVAGFLLPYSPIEGSYFSDVERQRIKPQQTLGNLGGNILNRQNPSSLFLQNTGSGQRSVLFNTIAYNRYKPDYTFYLTQLGSVLSDFFENPNSIGNLYIGRQESDIINVTSPPGASPVNAYGITTTTPVYGPDKVGILYEGDQNFQFGLAAQNYSERPVFDGGFVWISNLTKVEAGRTVGQDGRVYGNNTTFSPLSSSYQQVLSTNYPFRPGSILDITQRIIDSTPAQGKDRLSHVGNAMNQVSKVFWDGYKELTKGSKVKKYVNESGTEVGAEYCRIFSKDRPYYTYGDLQGTYANTSGADTNGNIRRYSYSVLDSAYNLNITPYKNGGTSVQGGSVKKYMFSLENLAWKSTPEFNNLPEAEKGPNGGRVMWFPPYELTFGDSSTANWQTTNFIGRPEPIYTYNNTSRQGDISFKIVVDHPSVLNLIVNKELQNKNSELINGVVNSFFSGCKKYDIYELARKFNQFDLETIEDLFQQVLESDSTSDEDKLEALESLPQDEGNPTDSENSNLSKNFNEYGFYFNLYDGTESATDYDTIYTNYISQQALYQQQQPEEPTDSFFDKVVTENYDKMVLLRDEVVEILIAGGEVSIELIGTTYLEGGDAEAKTQNQNRLGSVTAFFADYIFQGTLNKKYVENGKFKISLNSEIQTNTKPKSSESFDAFNCQNALTETNIGYTVQAMACRGLKIKNITITPPTPDNENSSAVNTNSNDNNSNLRRSSGQFLADVFGNKPKKKESISAKAKNLSKQVLRKLLNEQNYFEIIKQEDPFLYDSFKTKLKFFNPAFHSITPEGFNSRLTFLNQCVRPGNTIPTKNTSGNFETKDSLNTNFGSPPILVLRIGDFYNCKIAPESLGFTYESLDFNPEGIGVQPMIVTAKLSFKMIGGHGLKEPIERLQNALSFNYYANTEMYDERAIPTDTTNLTKILKGDESLGTNLKLLQNAANQTNNQNLASNQATNQNPTDGGNFVGNVSESTNTNGVLTGTIQYKNLVDLTVDNTQNYMNLVQSFITSTVNEYNYGVLTQLYNERLFDNGSLNTLQAPVTDVKILGKFNNYSNYITSVMSALITDIDNGTDMLTLYLISKNVPNNEIRIVQSNFKNACQSRKNTILQGIGSKIQSISNTQSEIYQIYRRMDLVCDETDGKLNPNGSVYAITNTTEPYESTDTLTDIRTDYTKIANDIKDYYSLLLTNNIIIEPVVSTLYFTPFTSYNPTGSMNLFFTLFSNDFTNNKPIENLSNLLTQDFIPISESTRTKVLLYLNSILPSINDEKQAQINYINNFFTGEDYLIYNSYNPQVDGNSVKGKDRDFTFTSAGSTSIQQENVSNIYKNVNIDSNQSTYNGKKYFN
jgi:hypothetical protein